MTELYRPSAGTHPITPPPELVQQWAKGSSLPSARITECQWQQRFARQAAQWGADMELKACCEWLFENAYPHKVASVYLRTARRPEPSSPAVDRLLDLQDRIQMGSLTLAEALDEIAGPKPPNSKEQALEALQFVDEKLKGHLPLHNHCNAIHTIGRALEQLPDAL